MVKEIIKPVDLSIPEPGKSTLREKPHFPKIGKKKILMSIAPGNMHGEVIGKIASNHYYAYEDTSVHDLADELIKMEDVFAVGVVDRENRVTGIISRVDLLDALSKQYGRDLYKNKIAGAMTIKVESFDHGMNIFTVAERISDSHKMKRNRYFLLTQREHFFAGVFSTRDMLMYLSDITRKDFAIAKQLQNGIVKDLLTVENRFCKIMGTTRMAKDIGGDFYAVKQVSDHEWFICVCDVIGKGMPAALMSSIIGGMTSIYNFTFGIERYLLNINDYIYQSFKGERFITGIFILFNDKTRDMTIYDAGHSFSLLLRNNSWLQLRNKAEMTPIGIISDFKPVYGKFVLLPGDLFIIYTDGIIEQRNAFAEEYGLQRFCRVVRDNCKKKPAEIRDNLFNDIKTFRGNQPQHDDMTMILMASGQRS